MGDVRLLNRRAGRAQFFDVSSASLDALFRKTTTALLIDNLHFHDFRAEALTRLGPAGRRDDFGTYQRPQESEDAA